MRTLLCILAALPLIVLAEEVTDKEINKQARCWSDEYRCYYSGTCIPNYKVCDGYEDCLYGDDEDNCYYYTTTEDYGCPDDYYECEYNGKCIPNYWLCDGYNDCPVYGDDEYPSNCDMVNSTTTTTTSSPVFTTHHPIKCDSPFDLIHDRCIFVDPFIKTDWNEARYLCQKFNSDLVILDDFKFYSSLLQYINNKGIESHDYWIGARDLEEGRWRWVDNTPVHVGAPLWALYGCNSDYKLEPKPSEASNQDCGCLDYDRGLYMNDADCDSKFSAICQRSTFSKESDAKQDKLEEVNVVETQT